MLRRSAGKSRAVHQLIIAGNDTVPISVCRGGGMRCPDCWCTIVVLFHHHYRHLPILYMTSDELKGIVSHVYMVL